MKKYTYLELLENLESFEVGTKFTKFQNGKETESKLIVQTVRLGSSYKHELAKELQWVSGTIVRYNRTFEDMYFILDSEYEEVSFVYALKSIDDGSDVIYTNDCDGDMVEIDLDDDMGCDFDIDSFADLLKRTKFYIKK